MKIKSISKNKVSRIPETNGVYCFGNGRKILYIGKAINLKKRIKDHFRKSGFRDHFFMDRVKRIGYIQTNSEIEALILEAQLIKKFQPKYNVMWRDDKSYLYVGITREPLPKVFITHQSQRVSSSLYLVSGIGNQKKKIQNTRYKIQNTRYIGPFTDAKALKTTLRLLRRVFPYYVSKKHSSKPCQNCLLGLCPGPNPGPANYKKNIKNLMAVLNGKKTTILKDLKKEMLSASRSQEFEKATEIRNQIFALAKIFQHVQIANRKSRFVLPRRSLCYYDYETKKWKEIAEKLREITGAKGKISRIEAYDVSNIQGQQATGSMVIFKNNRPDKSQYRLFKIRLIAKPNDTAMIKEVLERRFRHQEWPYPQMVLIDGGIGQLNTALEVKSQNAKCKSKSQNAKLKRIIFTALAKQHNELLIENRKQSLLLKNLPQEVSNLILRLRDEAHRFARNYHLKLRRKAFLDRD